MFCDSSVVMPTTPEPRSPARSPSASEKVTFVAGQGPGVPKMLLGGGPASGVPPSVGGGKTPPSGSAPASLEGGEMDGGPVLVPREHATAMLIPRIVANASRPVSRFHPRMPGTSGANGSWAPCERRASGLSGPAGLPAVRLEFRAVGKRRSHLFRCLVLSRRDRNAPLRSPRHRGGEGPHPFGRPRCLPARAGGRRFRSRRYAAHQQAAAGLDRARLRSRARQPGARSLRARDDRLLGSARHHASVRTRFGGDRGSPPGSPRVLAGALLHQRVLQTRRGGGGGAPRFPAPPRRRRGRAFNSPA